MPGSTILELATTLGTTPERLRDVVKRTLARVPRQQYYVFRITSAQQASSSTRDQPRMIAAFPTPDDALSFAQRNGYGSNAQLRALSAADLIGRMLAEATIGSILFVVENGGSARPGFGPGIKINRSDLLAYLQGDQPGSAELPDQPSAAVELPDADADQPAFEEHVPLDQIELSAAQYDALQFGINFTRRAEFRVALAQAVEQIVATYEPPAGSLDCGPRSIFATTAVELWLKEHGFPHVQQRRWIAVADDPAWGGAVELCELDGGTENRLLIQLLIHLDESGRQYIKQVNVTA